MFAMDAITRLRDMVRAANAMVAFTGAGISTESGIPDFRSPGSGRWNKIKPIEFQDFIASASVRQEAWRRRFEGPGEMERATPNIGHQVLAQLVQQGKVQALITQNIDNLHQASGIPTDKIIELHGNGTYAKCLRCQQRYELADLRAEFRQQGNVSPCRQCGGIIKSATISFGQAMPELEMARAQQVTENCDLFLVIGSSLQVYPAAGFPQLAKTLGAQLVVLNREPTPLDTIADLVLHEEIGPSLARLQQLLTDSHAG